MRIDYRPEIDGLRAVAVLSVIFYHAHITIFETKIFKGGFIGVDIFFVISGYLITSIILKELTTTGSFSFKKFYERRVRRIIPALLFVILITMPFAWIYLLPSSYVDFSKSILYSLGFSSNFFFHYSGQEYGAENGLLKPFLHTWSLSVEEQYYVLFPIILLVTFKYFKKYLGVILIIGFLISLFVANWGSKNYPSANFYFLHSRMWELIAGSILAYFEFSRGSNRQERKYQKFNSIFLSLGIILIILSITFHKQYFPHPSFYTLPAIIGVCLIIWFSNKDELITKILSSKLFVGLGLISYSLYLWHYPIFAFARISENFFTGNVISIIVLSILLISISYFTYLFIEKPSRNKDYKFKSIILWICFSFLVLIITNMMVIKNDGYKQRVPVILKNISFKKPRDLLKNVNNQLCFNNSNECVFNAKSNKKVYIIGDSHMGSLMFDLKNRIISNDYQFITSVISGCIFFPGFNSIQVKTRKINENCNNDYFLKLEKTLKKNKDSIIIFGGRLPLYLDNKYFDNKEGGIEGEAWENKLISDGKYDTIQSSFKNSINELSKNNKIILIYPIPEIGWNTQNKILNQYSKNFFSSKRKVELKYVTTSYQVYKDRTKSSFELLDSLRGENIFKVYPHKLFCNTLIDDRCVTHDDDKIFYYDDDHPSIEGAEMINSLIIKQIKKIEDKLN